MSVEGSYSSVVNRAVDTLIANHNLHVVVSAGNSARDACRVSPGSASGAVTVAAIDANLARWAYANWGACVDVFAPGVSIISAVPESDSSVGVKTGTSMAAREVWGRAFVWGEVVGGCSTAVGACTAKLFYCLLLPTLPSFSFVPALDNHNHSPQRLSLVLLLSTSNAIR